MSDIEDFEYTLTRRALRQIKAEVWDEAVRSLVYDDGTPVEIASNTNPYRAEPTQESK